MVGILWVVFHRQYSMIPVYPGTELIALTFLEVVANRLPVSTLGRGMCA